MTLSVGNEANLTFYMKTVLTQAAWTCTLLVGSTVITCSSESAATPWMHPSRPPAIVTSWLDGPQMSVGNPDRLQMVQQQNSHTPGRVLPRFSAPSASDATPRSKPAKNSLYDCGNPEMPGRESKTPFRSSCDCFILSQQPWENKFIVIGDVFVAQHGFTLQRVNDGFSVA